MSSYRQAVKKPIRCPGGGERGCGAITAVPYDGRMWLTEHAAGFYPNGYRCWAHARGAEVSPQPADAPARLPKNAVAA